MKARGKIIGSFSVATGVMTIVGVTSAWLDSRAARETGQVERAELTIGQFQAVMMAFDQVERDTLSAAAGTGGFDETMLEASIQNARARLDAVCLPVSGGTKRLQPMADSLNGRLNAIEAVGIRLARNRSAGEFRGAMAAAAAGLGTVAAHSIGAVKLDQQLRKHLDDPRRLRAGDRFRAVWTLGGAARTQPAGTSGKVAQRVGGAGGIGAREHDGLRALDQQRMAD